MKGKFFILKIWQKKDFDLFVSKYENSFNERFELSYENYSKGMNSLMEKQKKGKISMKINEDFISKEAILLVEKIRDILNESVDEKSFLNHLKTSELLISENKEVNSNEKKFLIINLEFIKYHALNEDSNARVYGVTSTKPKCKWYQWGCVFATHTAQFAAIFSFWAFNDLMGSVLSILVSEHGLLYVTQCCGWCNCECPAGCPSFI